MLRMPIHHEMPVHAIYERFIGVAELLFDVLAGLPEFEQHRAVRVPKAVEMPVGKLCGREERSVVPPLPVRGVDGKSSA